MYAFDVFGRAVGVAKEGGQWKALYLGADGKHRPAPGIVIPPWTRPDDLAVALADIFHESARAERPEVRPLEPGSFRLWRRGRDITSSTRHIVVIR